MRVLLTVKSFRHWAVTSEKESPLGLRSKSMIRRITIYQLLVMDPWCLKGKLAEVQHTWPTPDTENDFP